MFDSNEGGAKYDEGWGRNSVHPPPPLSCATGQIHNELQFYIPVISLDIEFSKDSQLFNTNITSKGESREGVVNILLSRVGTPQKTAPPPLLLLSHVVCFYNYVVY